MSQLETASRQRIEAHQVSRLQLGLAQILPHNAFYREKLLQGTASPTIARLEDLASLPFTTKSELLAD